MKIKLLVSIFFITTIAAALNLPPPSFSLHSSIKNTLPSPASSADFVGLSLLWRHNLHQKNAELILTPALNADSLFFGAPSGDVFAFDLLTGQSKWSKGWKKPFSTSASVTSNFLILGDAQGQLFSFSTQNGEEQWQKLLSGEVLARPIIYQDKIFVKTEDDGIYALDLTKGHLIWVHPGSTPSTSLRVGSSPAIAKGLVIIGRSDGYVMAFDIQTGALKWYKQIATPHGEAFERMVSINASPVVYQDTAYVVAYQGPLMALGLKQGKLQWRYPVSSYTGLAVNQNGLFLSDDQGRLWAFSLHEGNVLWKTQVLSEQPLTAPTLYHGVIFIATAQGQLYELSQKSGQLLTRFKATDNAIMSPPVIQGHRLCVTSQTGELACYQLLR